MSITSELMRDDDIMTLPGTCISSVFSDAPNIFVAAADGTWEAGKGGAEILVQVRTDDVTRRTGRGKRAKEAPRS